MDDFDLSSALQDLGVSERDSLRIKATLTGSDLMNLIEALRDVGQGQNLARASAILGKYGVQIRSHAVNKDTNFLKAKFESLRGGQTLDETFGVMTPLGESFSYAIEINEQNRDRVLDWLDENQVEYQATSPTHYNISCGDRDVAYRTGRALSGILGKPTVRDSVETEVTEMAKKSTSRRVKDAQAKMAQISPKDPNLSSIVARSGSGVHNGGKKNPHKDDAMGRKTKYKPRFDEEIENSNLSEGVIGMKPLNPIFRLRELAGLPMRANEDDIDGIEIADAPVIDPDGHLAAGPVSIDPADDIDAPADVSADEPDGMGSDPVADPMADMDGGMDSGMDDMGGDTDDMSGDLDGGIDDPMGAPMADPMAAGMPGDIGSDPIEAVPGADAPTQSDAMSQIEDSLNGIQTMLADIRLSEYKSLIKKLQDLTNQAQMMGRDYLGERRRK